MRRRLQDGKVLRARIRARALPSAFRAARLAEGSTSASTSGR
ncbi:hypothetical protein [Polyangium fumosum]|nr:hypothetical protein [Polyangium fumosum]